MVLVGGIARRRLPRAAAGGGRTHYRGRADGLWRGSPGLARAPCLLRRAKHGAPRSYGRCDALRQGGGGLGGIVRYCIPYTDILGLWLERRPRSARAARRAGD